MSQVSHSVGTSVEWRAIHEQLKAIKYSIVKATQQQNNNNNGETSPRRRFQASHRELATMEHFKMQLIKFQNLHKEMTDRVQAALLEGKDDVALISANNLDAWEKAVLSVLESTDQVIQKLRSACDEAELKLTNRHGDDVERLTLRAWRMQLIEAQWSLKVDTERIKQREYRIKEIETKLIEFLRQITKRLMGMRGAKSEAESEHELEQALAALQNRIVSDQTHRSPVTGKTPYSWQSLVDQLLDNPSAHNPKLPQEATLPVAPSAGLPAKLNHDRKRLSCHSVFTDEETVATLETNPSCDAEVQAVAHLETEEQAVQTELLWDETSENSSGNGDMPSSVGESPALARDESSLCTSVRGRDTGVHVLCKHCFGPEAARLMNVNSRYHVKRSSSAPPHVDPTRTSSSFDNISTTQLLHEMYSMLRQQQQQQQPNPPGDVVQKSREARLRLAESLRSLQMTLRHFSKTSRSERKRVNFQRFTKPRRFRVKQSKHALPSDIDVKRSPQQRTLRYRWKRSNTDPRTSTTAPLPPTSSTVQSSDSATYPRLRPDGTPIVLGVLAKRPSPYFATSSSPSIGLSRCNNPCTISVKPQGLSSKWACGGGMGALVTQWRTNSSRRLAFRPVGAASHYRKP